MTVIQGRIVKLEVGESVADHTDVTNVKSMKWDEEGDSIPRFLPDQKYPHGWLHTHSHIVGTIEVLSHTTAFDHYLVNHDGEVPYVRVTFITTAGTEVQEVFAGFTVKNWGRNITNEGEEVQTISFKAYYMT